MIASMKTIHAIYEDGVFRPMERVDLPEHCEVEIEARPWQRQPSKESLAEVYAILSERFETGAHDVAARHNEHQP